MSVQTPLLIIDAERDHPEGHQRRQRDENAAERLRNAEKYPLHLAHFLYGESELRQIDEGFSDERDDAEKERRLQGVAVIELHAAPEIVGDENPLPSIPCCG